MQQVETYIGKEVLESIPLMRGMMWEKIETVRRIKRNLSAKTAFRIRYIYS